MLVTLRDHSPRCFPSARWARNHVRREFFPTRRTLRFRSPQAVMWIEAAKRLGVTYVCMAAGTSASVVAQRLADVGATALITTETLLQTAQVTCRARATRRPRCQAL
eukprot:5280097-Prymnesium_polylepis.1